VAAAAVHGRALNSVVSQLDSSLDRSAMVKLSSTVTFVLTTILVGSAVPQTVGGAPEPPRFEDYPVGRIFKRTPAPVDLRSHPQARSFRTRLREGAKHGPNFAGHLTIVTWGCGTSCRQLAIVDAKTGGVTFGPLYTVEVGFRLDSRLLIVNTPESILEYYGGRCPERGRSIDTVSSYFAWDGRELKEVTSIDLCPEQSGELSNSIRADAADAAPLTAPALGALCFSVEGY